MLQLHYYRSFDQRNIPIVLSNAVCNHSSQTFIFNSSIKSGFFIRRLPYDWRAPLGYLFAVSYQLTTFLGVLEVFVTCLVIYCSVCKFSVAFADDLVANFNEICRKIGECNGHFVAKKETILNQELTEIMDFQRNAVQLSLRQTKCQPSFYYLLICLFLYSCRRGQTCDAACKTLQTIPFDDFRCGARVSLLVFITFSSGKSQMLISIRFSTIS